MARLLSLLLAFSAALLFFLSTLQVADAHFHFHHHRRRSTKNLKAATLSAVNKLRTKHHVPAFTWDTELQSIAQRVANKCKFQHSGSHDSKGASLGENIAAGQSSISAVIKSWYGEVSDYNYDDPMSSTGTTGHFTQLVWKGSKKIGCAVKQCKGIFAKMPDYTAPFYVCEFSPAGNIVGNNGKYYRKNVKKP